MGRRSGHVENKGLPAFNDVCATYMGFLDRWIYYITFVQSEWSFVQLLEFPVLYNSFAIALLKQPWKIFYSENYAKLNW